MKFIGGRLRGWEKANGNLWDWIKSKVERHIVFYIGGYRVVNNEHL